jgi:hypothetical protein
MYIPNVGHKCEILLDSEVTLMAHQNRMLLKKIVDDPSKTEHKLVLPKGLVLTIKEMSSREHHDFVHFKVENDIMGLKEKWMIVLSRENLNNNLNVKWIK